MQALFLNFVGWFQYPEETNMLIFEHVFSGPSFKKKKKKTVARWKWLEDFLFLI